jgi:hypothetical protein
MSARAELSARGSHRLRSAGVVAFAFFANAIVTTITDQIFHILDVYPPWGQPMHEPALNALALSYRIVFAVLAGYLVARLAPAAPMRHVLVLGTLGLVAASIAAFVTITRYDLGPAWYPIAIAVTALPAVWLGGQLHARRAR